ncbi:MAG: AAA family ATPase [Acidimicrobiaceae bacterium]|nr:AAA family ATPase [Acidimicrobiaceae bacterium]
MYRSKRLMYAHSRLTIPRGFLAQLENGAFIDEVQRVPELLSYLQGAIDGDPTPDRWMLTGSHNLALLQSVSQSLAGRTAGVALVEARATATPNSRLLDGPRRVWTDLTDDLGDVSLSPSTAVLIRSTAAPQRRVAGRLGRIAPQPAGHACVARE